MTKIIIFGASGDLARRKLFPALYKVKSTNFQVTGYSRSELQETFHDHISKLFSYDEEFLKRIKYVSGQYNDLSKIKEEVTESTVCYLSVPPHLYILLIKQLIILGAKKICLEKPFGEDLESFLEIKKLQEENQGLQIYFVDHYLYKPMTVAIPLLYEKNPLLKEILQGKFVDNVQILFKEQLGSEGRVYFENTGLVKDVIQNHVGEILGTLAACNGENRINLLGKANPINKSECIFGQYDEYRKELMTQSNTETFSLLTVTFDDQKWTNVPFILVAGKGMDEKRVEGRFQLTESGFKKAVDLLNEINPGRSEEFKQILKDDSLRSIHLVFNYSPENEIYFEMTFLEHEVKIPLVEESEIMELMKSKYEDLTDHEIVFEGLVENHKMGCAETKEVEYLWKLFNPKVILQEKNIFFYLKGIDMPLEAVQLIKKITKSYRKKR